MLPFISSLIRKKEFQDFAGVCRGIYRVVDGVNQPQLIKDNLIDQFKQEKQTTPINEKRETIKKPEQEQQQPTPQIQNKINEQIKDTHQRKGKEQDQQSNDQQSQIPSPPPINKQFTENKVPQTAIGRVYEFGALGVSLATNAMKTMVTQQNVSFRQALVSEENASLLAKGLCKMRGAPLKLAQALSIQEDEVIPKHIRQAFEQARQNADIMPQKQLEKMLKQELGSDWTSKFKEFELKPFAAASIGQVHEAITTQGRRVAVKIQYPGVKEAIDSDLNNLKRLMEYTNLFPKTMFLDKLIANTRKELHEECDYKIEAAKQINYRKLFGNQSEFAIPEVLSDLSTTRILTAEYLYGDTIDFAAENYPQHLRNEIGRRVMSLTLQELFKFRTMQTDPNPSNFYFDRHKNKLILLDFGAVHEYTKPFMDNYIGVIYAATILDRKECLQRSVDLGFLTGEESIRMKEAHVDSIICVGEPFRHQGEFDFGEQQMTKKIYELMPVMLKYRMRPPPPEIYSLHRKLSGAYLMNMRLKTKVNCRDIFMNLYEQYIKLQ
ncbi:unnamed protein product (macronuclear) [Paramecium tetraurelia]|uniref:ABC1 atypical kinase-like domain-containing protein n=1 Tax=Paramecium tetraurelia TaxID=5888 RepID=A0EGN9_PARTE|nr:uncharacterized protein GSPATT00026804001 [Paramecium tetraurelia]CAK94480.1 unnamed protein product [Paramecium tetraurelia]|eukprot:XP_001461853.1 hypothetical protein (macronuclear) [Paramecium tetraurelia strain d4-2]